MSSVLPLLSAIALGIGVFTVTNVDDLCILTGFFADRRLQTQAIVLGQVAGIAILTLVSACAAQLAFRVPAGWLGLLGFAPLLLGVRGFIDLWKAHGVKEAGQPETESAARIASTGSVALQSTSIALVTLANGGDNLGVYIPMFAQHGRLMPLYIAIFALMTALWCILSHWLVHHRILGIYIRKYGRIALPFVLVGLGLDVLSGARILLPLLT